MPVVRAGSAASSPRGLLKEIVQITGDTTITSNHIDRLLVVNSSSTVTLTLPSGLLVGAHFEWERYGAGAVIFAAAAGGTLHGANSNDRALVRYSRGSVAVTAQGADGQNQAAVWNLSGSITDTTGVTTSTVAEQNYNAGVTAGTALASKALVLGASKEIATITTATITNINSSGTDAFSGVVNITGGDTNITTSSASTDGGTSVEPVLVSTTMTGAGGVGGRSRFYLTTNVALGSWSNALKGEVTYGAAGKTTGLGSAVLAEMTLSAGTTDGNYAPIEIELNLGSNALTGTLTALIYMSVNGADKATFDTNGVVFNLQGLTAASGKCLQTGNTFGTPAATLKVQIGGTIYYLPLYATQITS